MRTVLFETALLDFDNVRFLSDATEVVQIISHLHLLTTTVQLPIQTNFYILGSSNRV